MMAKLPKTVIIAGPALTGKSTIAKQLESNFSYYFIEGDELHPPANVAKMSKGEPLNDDDRIPWLNIVSQEITKNAETHVHVVATCSALRPHYRDIIRKNCDDILFVYLTASFETLYHRAKLREHSGTHFFNAAKNPQLLKDQLANSQPPYDEPDSLVIDLDNINNHESKEAVFCAIVGHLGLSHAMCM